MLGRCGLRRLAELNFVRFATKPASPQAKICRESPHSEQLWACRTVPSRESPITSTPHYFQDHGTYLFIYYIIILCFTLWLSGYLKFLNSLDTPNLGCCLRLCMNGTEEGINMGEHKQNLSFLCLASPPSFRPGTE